MSFRERADLLQSRTIERYGPDSEAWPMSARAELASLQRKARVEEFYTTDHITQRDIDIERATDDALTRITIREQRQRKMMIARGYARDDADSEWHSTGQEWQATLDGDITVWDDENTPNVKIVIRVEWRDAP